LINSISNNTDIIGGPRQAKAGIIPQADGEIVVDLEKSDVSAEEEPKEEIKETKPPKSNTVKVGKRTAFVYSGAAILIVVVGMRTLLQMADEGFGMVEYFTIGALVVEFSVLLLYAFTIYSVSKDDARKEGFTVQSKDMPAVALQLQYLSQSVNAEIRLMQSKNDRLHELYDNDIPALSNGLADLTKQLKNALDEMRGQQTLYDNDIPALSNGLADLTKQLKNALDEMHGQQSLSNDQMKELIQTISISQKGSELSGEEESSKIIVEKFMGQMVENDAKTKIVNERLLEQLTKNERHLIDYTEQTLALSNGIKEVIEEQVTLRIRQEIQHILSAPIVKQSGS